MLWSICVVTFFLGYSAHGAFINSTDDPTSFLATISEIIEKKCLQNADQNQYSQVKNELDNLVRHCFNLLNPPDDNDEVFTKRCYVRTDQVIQCLNRFGEKLEPCLEADEKYMSQFFPEVYRHMANYYCQHVTEVIAAMMGTNNRNCLEKFRISPVLTPEVCWKYSSELKNYASITKVDLCSLQTRIQQCYNDMVSTLCPDALQVQIITSEFWKAILAPCSDVQPTTKSSVNATE